MCDYILRVGYKNEKSTDQKYFECGEGDVTAKMEELLAKEQVRKVAVFKNRYSNVRIDQWKRKKHKPKKFVVAPEETAP